MISINLFFSWRITGRPGIKGVHIHDVDEPRRICVDVSQKLQRLRQCHLLFIDIRRPVFHISAFTVQIILGNGLHGFHRRDKIQRLCLYLGSAYIVCVDHGARDSSRDQKNIAEHQDYFI